MSYVGNKKFAYTDEGQKKAYEYAAKMNKPISDVNNFGNENDLYKQRKNARNLKPYNLSMGI
jgi:hypothetical protein